MATDALIALGSGAVVHGAWSAAGAVSAGTVFTVLERRSANPVLVPAVLRTPGMLSALLAGAAVNFTMTGVLFVLPLLCQQALHLTPLKTGTAFLPMTLPFAFNPLLTGRIVAKAGPRKPLMAGLGLLTVGGLVLAAAILTGSAYPVLVIGLVCTGFGVSFALPALVTTVITTARRRRGRGQRAPQRYPSDRRHPRRRCHGCLRHRRPHRHAPRRGYAVFLSAAICATAGLGISRRS